MSRARGFSLLEVMVAVAVLAVAILAVLATIGQTAQLRRVSSETEVATEVLHAQVAVARGAGTDSLAAVVALEGTFAVTDPRLKDATGTLSILTEAQASTALRTDVDGDGDIDAADLYDLDLDGIAGEGALTTPGDTTTGSLKTDYGRLVPVRVTVSWTSSARKTRTAEVVTFVYPTGTTGS